MERNGKAVCTMDVEEEGNERSPGSQSITKAELTGGQQRGASSTAFPFRAGPGRRTVSHPGRSLAEWGSYMALGVNVSRGCQVPNWRSYFSHWFFLPSSTLTDYGISFPLLILSSPLLCLKQLSAQWTLRNLNCLTFQPCFPGLDSPMIPEVPKGLWAKAGAQAHPKGSQTEDRWSGLSVKPPVSALCRPPPFVTDHVWPSWAVEATALGLWENLIWAC